MEKQLVYTEGRYQTTCLPRSQAVGRFPTLNFYTRLLFILFRSSRKAKRHQYDGEAWGRSSFDVLNALEQVGVRFDIQGIEAINQVKGPCIFIANHMSMLETLVLPAIIQPLKEVTFVVKQSLLSYPVFKHIMRSRNPIAVGRANPRKDFTTVIKGGADRLQNNISVIIFPQTTRTSAFDQSQFNTIGIKLAKKTQVPIIPIALITDAWQNGRYFKDFGRINPSKRVVFSFGKPLWVHDHGNGEHAAILDFIGRSLETERGAGVGAR